MAVSRRLRFEILRRDNYACRYCGASAPDVKLTVDHVVPTSLGGRDEPANLVAACAPCNAGKSSATADQTVVDDVAQDALRWARAMKVASESVERDAQWELDLAAAFVEDWEEVVATWAPLPDGYSHSIMQFVRAGLRAKAFEAALHQTAGANHVSDENRFRYFCGICWRMVNELQDRARAIVETET